jgi:hypothetical protein
VDERIVRAARSRSWGDDSLTESRFTRRTKRCRTLAVHRVVQHAGRETAACLPPQKRARKKVKCRVSRALFASGCMTRLAGLQVSPDTALKETASLFP